MTRGRSRKSAKSEETSDERNSMIYLHILKMLSKHQDITVKDVLAQLALRNIHRCERQIQRLMKAMCQEFDVQCNDTSRPYGYRWKQQAVGLSANKLTPTESLVLALAKQHLYTFLPSKLLPTVDQMFNAAGYNLDYEEGFDLAKQWLKKVHTASQNLPLLPPEYRDGVLTTVTDALYQNQILEIEYRKPSGEIKIRQFEPWGLIRQGVRMYLVCRHLKYDNPVSLAIHRIQSANNTGHTFTPPPDLDLRKFDEEGYLNYGKGQKVRVEIWMEKSLSNQYQETKLDKNQMVVEDGCGGVVITATLFDSLRLERWLCGFGSRAKLISKTLI